MSWCFLKGSTLKTKWKKSLGAVDDIGPTEQRKAQTESVGSNENEGYLNLSDLSLQKI